MRQQNELGIVTALPVMSNSHHRRKGFCVRAWAGKSLFPMPSWGALDTQTTSKQKEPKIQPSPLCPVAFPEEAGLDSAVQNDGLRQRPRGGWVLRVPVGSDSLLHSLPKSC